MKKRAYPEQERIMNKRLSGDSNSEPVNNTIVPDGEEFKVGEAVKDILNILMIYILGSIQKSITYIFQNCGPLTPLCQHYHHKLTTLHSSP